jgi:glycerol-1-phosphate dehydrogenase [NAD(P)+]
MSGIAMQMMGNSRPASGAEHHISHMIEMGPKKFEVLFPAMHGEKTGVGTILAAKEYYRMAETEDISQRALVYKPVSDTYLLDFFGEELAESVIDENREDCLAQVTPEALVKNWQRVREIIWKIPSPETLYAQLEKLEAKRDPEDIGITSNQIETLLEYSPLVRNRVTLMRMRRMLNL